MSDALSRGPHDFCRDEDCGAFLNLRDSWRGDCFSHRKARYARLYEHARKLRELVETRPAPKGRPRRRES